MQVTFSKTLCHLWTALITVTWKRPSVNIFIFSTKIHGSRWSESKPLFAGICHRRGVEWCVPKLVPSWTTGTTAPRPHRSLRFSRMNLEDTSHWLGQRALEEGLGLGDGLERWHWCSNTCTELNSAQHLQTLHFSPDVTCRPHGQPCQPQRNVLLQIQLCPASHGDTRGAGAGRGTTKFPLVQHFTEL